MARPPTITEDEILAAARAVFLEKGILATVEEVAERCRVGQATVFRRFPTKQALFMAAMETAGDPEWARSLPERIHRCDIRANLTELTNEILYWARKRIPLLMMKMSNPSVGDRPGPPAYVFRAFTLMTEFMTEQARTGRIRLGDPRVATRILMGTIQNAVMFEAVARPGDGLTAEQVVAGLMDLLCVEPTDKGAQKSGSQAKPGSQATPVKNVRRART
jgi:AcrR family transcriptional regulator